MPSLGRSMIAGLVVSLSAAFLLFPDPTGTRPLLVAPVAAVPVGAWLYRSGVSSLVSLAVVYVVALVAFAIAFAPVVLALGLFGLPTSVLLAPVGVELIAVVPVAGAALVAREVVYRRGYAI